MTGRARIEAAPTVATVETNADVRNLAAHPSTRKGRTPSQPSSRSSQSVVQTMRCATTAMLSLFACVHGYSLGVPSTYAQRTCDGPAVKMAADLADLGVTGLPIEKTVKGFRTRQLRV